MSESIVSEYTNDIPPKGVEPEFTEAIINAKKSLYDNTVYQPQLGTEKAQNLKLLVVYLQYLNILYKNSIIVINNSSVKQADLEKIPKEARQAVKTALNVIYNYFQKADLDKTPYEHFINYHLKENQFLLIDK